MRPLNYDYLDSLKFAKELEHDFPAYKFYLYEPVAKAKNIKIFFNTHPDRAGANLLGNIDPEISVILKAEDITTEQHDGLGRVVYAVFNDYPKYVRKKRRKNKRKKESDINRGIKEFYLYKPATLYIGPNILIPKTKDENIRRSRSLLYDLAYKALFLHLYTSKPIEKETLQLEYDESKRLFELDEIKVKECRNTKLYLIERENRFDNPNCTNYLHDFDFIYRDEEVLRGEKERRFFLP